MFTPPPLPINIMYNNNYNVVYKHVLILSWIWPKACCLQWPSSVVCYSIGCG